MAVTEYKWTDAGAPQITNTPGALITVLNACLVNGYGSKAAAGFALVYTGTNKAAFRASAGTERCYLRVVDDNTTIAKLQLFDTMSDVDTGTGQVPSTGIYFGGSGYSNYFVFLKAHNTLTQTIPGTNPIPWSVYSDGKFVLCRFQFAIDNGSTGTPDAFIGETLFKADKSGYIVSGGGRTFIFGEYVPTSSGYRHSVLGAYIGEGATTPSISFTAYPYSNQYATAYNSHWTDFMQASVLGSMAALAVNGHPEAPTTPMICLAGGRRNGFGASGRSMADQGWFSTGGLRQGEQPINRVTLQTPSYTAPGYSYVVGQVPIGWLPGIWYGPTPNTNDLTHMAYNRFFGGDYLVGRAGSHVHDRTWVVKEQLAGSFGAEYLFIELTDTWRTL